MCFASNQRNFENVLKWFKCIRNVTKTYVCVCVCVCADLLSVNQSSVRYYNKFQTRGRIKFKCVRALTVESRCDEHNQIGRSTDSSRRQLGIRNDMHLVMIFVKTLSVETFWKLKTKLFRKLSLILMKTRFLANISNCIEIVRVRL